MLIVRIIATLDVERVIVLGRILVERFKGDIVLSEQVLVLAETFQQRSLGKSASSPALSQRPRHTLCLRVDAIFARKFSITLDLALLTKYTRKHPLWLRRLGGRGSHVRRHGISKTETKLRG